MDAAIKVFAERGFHTATVAEIARGAGVADGTIYLYFKSKDDLLLRLFDEKMTELLEAARSAIAHETTQPARLRPYLQLQPTLMWLLPHLTSPPLLALPP